MSEGQIGDVKFSILNEKEFKKLDHEGWILMKSINIKHTDLFPLIEKEIPDGMLPDAQGVFIRGMNGDRDTGEGDPDGNKAVGRYQKDAYERHHHFGQRGQARVKLGGNSDAYVTSPLRYDKPNTPTSGYVEMGNAEETRPRNIALYVYIKIAHK